MFLTRSEYDRGVNTFSPEGRLFQVEYALETVKLGTTSIGIQTKQGVVLVAEKRSPSKLLVDSSMHKISDVDKHIAVTSSGLIADSRTLINHARDEAQNFFFNYGRRSRVADVTRNVANLALHFADDDSKVRMGRPFGVAMLFGGVDQSGPKLFHLDPSGTFIDCLAKAIGAASDGAEQNLKEKYHKEMTLLEAEKVALTILKQVMEEKLAAENVEVVTIIPKIEADGMQGGEIKRLTKDELETLIADI